MASYASTVTLATNRAQRWRGSGWGFLIGQVDITNYNSTTTEETDITKHFKSLTVGGTALKCILIPEGTSDNGYSVEWIPSSGKFKAYREASAGAKVEASNDTDIGVVHFIAIGLVY